MKQSHEFRTREASNPNDWLRTSYDFGESNRSKRCPQLSGLSRRSHGTAFNE
jgi:hypothetical protein